jgi:diguanylate cyclase (GGDEF)-like protein
MKSPAKILVFLLIFQFYFCFVNSPSLFGQYHFDSWTTDEGLPQNGIRDITQTPDGYLWFTTFDGLVRFDGVRFTTFGKSNTPGIINNRFTKIHSEKDGTLYAATMEDGTLTVYRNGTFYSYSSDQVPLDYIRLIKTHEDGRTRFLAVNEKGKTEVWYYLENGKFVFDEKIDKENIRLEYRGKSGRVWLVTPDQVIEELNGRKTVYPHRTKNLNSVRETFEDSDGGLWMSGTELIRFKDGKIENLGNEGDFPESSDFHSFWEEEDGSVWFVNGGFMAVGTGLVRYQNEKFSYFGEEQGLSESSIFDVHKDREGTVWLATNKGINRLRQDVIKTYSVKDGLIHSEVYPLYRDSRDAIWIGTIKGLSIYQNGRFETVKLKPTTEDVPKHTKWKDGKMSVQSLFEDSKGKMWIGVSGGVFLIENDQAIMLPESEGHHIFSIQEDKSGNIWAAGNKGILRLNNYQITAFYTSEDGLPNSYMTTIHEDSQGRLWFGGLGGLSEFKDGKFINYTKKEGLAGNYVRSIYEDQDGILWIGTYDEGLSRLKNGEFVNYRAENGLYNNGVFAIEEDKRGNFWISSNSGIYRVNRNQLNNFADGKVTKISSTGYGKEDGMLNSECNGGRQPASLTDKDGNFWFPTQNGVVVINPDLEAHNTLPPSVVIESATIERKLTDVHKGLFIEAGQKNIEIKFTGISLIKSDQIKFKYKLEGHDSDWIDAGTRRTAYYSYLPPGNYTFRVTAANSDGIWNAEGASIQVELKPYFYQTVWFYLFCVVAIILILLAIWKLSVYQLESRKRQLAKLVEEKTEELRRANEELQHLANSDGLTAIGNRRRFEKFLADEWHRAIRFKTEISLVLLDIDHFKFFNDTYGHLAGDDCLKKVAESLKDTIHRPTDLVARFGGEEFAIVLGGTDAKGALMIAQQAFECINNLKISHQTSETGNHLTVSVGVATIFAELGMTEDTLIKASDEALYEAKENGRNQIISKDLTRPDYHIPAIDKEYRDRV